MQKITVHQFHIGNKNIPQFVSHLQRTAPPFDTEIFFEEIIKIDFTEFSSRLLHHWESKKILLSERANETGWRKFRVVETFWLNIISELREYDVSLEIIRSIKEILIPNNAKTGIEYDLLKNLILCCFCHVPINLVLLRKDNHFEAGVITTNWLKELIHPPSSYSSIIELNLNKIAQKIFPKENLKPIDWTERGQGITTEEAKLLLELRKDNWIECELKRKNGKPITISKTLEKDVKEKIVNILSKEKDIDVSIRSRDGKITYITTKNSKTL